MSRRNVLNSIRRFFSGNAELINNSHEHESYVSLRAVLQKDLISAMKGKDKIRQTTIKNLTAAITYAEKSTPTENSNQGNVLA